MGFQDMMGYAQKAASSKGGKVKVDKGFAKNKELAKIAGAKGGHAKEANKTKRPERPINAERETSVMDEILGVLGEDSLHD